jgi:hypothetical protein
LKVSSNKNKSLFAVVEVLRAVNTQSLLVVVVILLV